MHSKNQTNQVSNGSMNIIDQANNALKNSPLNIIDQANNALKNSPLNIIDQANNALKNSPLNIIDQANNALKDKTSQTNDSSTGLIDQAAIKKLENIYSLTNTVGMSMVNGITINEITVGENNVTATIDYQPTQNDTGTSSLPVTVIVTKLPVENLTKFVIFAAESSKMASTLSSGSDSVESLLEKTKLTPDTLNLALNSLDLMKNLQTGVASATLSSLDNSQKISIQTPEGLASSFSSAPNEFVTVMVVPSMGVGPFPSNIPSIFSK
ncbi:MAG: hypothetical protein P0116_09135 [Candidatus Nitrosocosmicus sp.]|nr:hypothetical protein [Candidatus Nitrosocosmicus sp.]